MATVTAASNAKTDPLAAYRMTSSTGGTDNGQDRFLTMLVAQMKNQDPLNPLDNAQVTSQLAQINTVKGIENMNSTLTDLAARFDAMQVMQAASLVDRSVLVAGTAIPVSDTGAAGAYELAAAADSVKIRILDGTGNEVYATTQTAKAAGLNDFKWDGKLANGKQAAPGTYKLEVTATTAGQPVTASPFVSAKVSSLSRASDGFALTLSNGSTASLADIRRLS